LSAKGQTWTIPITFSLSHCCPRPLRADIISIMTQRLFAIVALAVVTAATWVGYQFVHTQKAADVYRQRLDQLSADYDQLRDTYNQAVRRTAVTELLVAGGKLSVVIRTAEGVLRTIPTDFDPRSEIYVDYIVLDGRLWIRRLFDNYTPPHSGLLIDPLLEELDWDSPRLGHGKAVYRRLGEGRWIITVTGDGSLGLARANTKPAELQPPPLIREFQVIEPDAKPRTHLTPLDILR
jgi:hypothetical protein